MARQRGSDLSGLLRLGVAAGEALLLGRTVRRVGSRMVKPLVRRTVVVLATLVACIVAAMLALMLLVAALAGMWLGMPEAPVWLLLVVSAVMACVAAAAGFAAARAQKVLEAYDGVAGEAGGTVDRVVEGLQDAEQEAEVWVGGIRRAFERGWERGAQR